MLVSGKFPSLTAAQIVALVGAVLGVLVSFGVDVSTEQQQAIIVLVGLVASALVVSDAKLRASRNERAAVENAAARITTEELQGTPVQNAGSAKTYVTASGSGSTFGQSPPDVGAGGVGDPLR